MKATSKDRRLETFRRPSSATQVGALRRGDWYTRKPLLGSRPSWRRGHWPGFSRSPAFGPALVPWLGSTRPTARAAPPPLSVCTDLPARAQVLFPPRRGTTRPTASSMTTPARTSSPWAARSEIEIGQLGFEAC